jgi:hypothetical protein
VKRKGYILGTLVVLLGLHVTTVSPAYTRIVQSAQNFKRYYDDLNKGENSLNSVERVVFSLVLAGSRS